MLTVKQAKELGVVFVEGDVIKDEDGVAYNESWYTNEAGLFDDCQVTSFTDRKHIGDEMPCGGGLPIVVEVIDGDKFCNLAANFEWVNDNTSLPIVVWKPNLEALEKLANKREEKPVKKPNVGELWEHHSGRAYKVIGLTNTTNISKKYPATVVYQNTVNGSLWSRPLGEWSRSFKLCSLNEGIGAITHTCVDKITPIVEPQKQYTYELVTNLSTNEIAKAMIDGEVFYNFNGKDKYLWENGMFVNKVGDHISTNRKLYRRKEIEMVTRTITYPKPVSEPLRIGDEYWCVFPDFIQSYEWGNDSDDKKWLLLGMIHLTKENAQAHLDALFGNK